MNVALVRRKGTAASSANFCWSEKGVGGKDRIRCGGGGRTGFEFMATPSRAGTNEAVNWRSDAQYGQLPYFLFWQVD